MTEEEIKLFSSFMADRIFEDVTSDSMPHCLSSHDGSEQAWLLKQIREPLMSYQGGAAWDRAERKFKSSFPVLAEKLAHLHGSAEESTPEGDIDQCEINRIDYFVQAILKAKADTLRADIEEQEFRINGGRKISVNGDSEENAKTEQLLAWLDGLASN